MTRRALALVAVAALCAAAALAAASPPAPSSPAASLGGLRVVLVDALFLRAEALRKEGRFDDVPAIYRRILELDPGSDVAVDHLADVLASDLRTLAATPDGRVRWWNEADALVREAIRRDPRSARLRFRAAMLLLAIPEQDDAVAASLKTRGVDREREGLQYLAEAAARADSIPRLGFAHLEALVRRAPRLAAERLAKGDRVVADEALAIGHAVANDREAALSSFTLGEGASGEGAMGESAERLLPAYVVLLAGVNLVEHVRDALGKRPPDAAGARGLLTAYLQALGQDAVTRALAPLLPP